MAGNIFSQKVFSFGTMIAYGMTKMIKNNLDC